MFWISRIFGGGPARIQQHTIWTSIQRRSGWRWSRFDIRVINLLANYLHPLFAEPQEGQTAIWHYSGEKPIACLNPLLLILALPGYLLENGAPFDSSYERRKPFSFRVGGGDVIRGWDEAARSMRIGGRRVIIVPPALGYGAAGAGGGRIPGEASLVFFLELLSISP